MAARRTSFLALFFYVPHEMYVVRRVDNGQTAHETFDPAKLNPPAQVRYPRLSARVEQPFSVASQ